MPTVPQTACAPGRCGDVRRTPLAARCSARIGADCRLLGEAQKGNVHAAGSLLTRHKDVTVAFVRRRVDASDVDDVVAEVMVSAVAAIPSLRTARCRGFCALMATLVRRRVADLRRASACEVDQCAYGDIEDRAAAACLSAVEARELAAALLADLPRRQALIVALHAYFGLPFREVGALVEVSEDGAEHTYRRGLAGLRSRVRRIP